MRPQAEAIVAKRTPRTELPWDEEDHKLSWLAVAETLEHNLRTDLASLWLELRAAEIILRDVAAEFDGEDPLSVPLRRLSTIRRRSCLACTRSSERSTKRRRRSLTQRKSS